MSAIDIETPEPETQKRKLNWDKDCLSYVAEVQLSFADFHRRPDVRNFGTRSIWLPTDKGNLCLGNASNLRTAEPADGRMHTIVVCDLNFDWEAWGKGWKANGPLQAWAETGQPNLRVMDLTLLGPVEIKVPVKK